MISRVFASMLVMCIPMLGQSRASGTTVDFEAVGKRIEAAPPDPAIAQALRDISADQIRNTIESLVAFHNRNTLSSMDTGLKPGEGVTAAAEWIEKQFRSYSDACGGCLVVKADTFTTPAAPPPKGRVPGPTKLTNVYAVLRGSDPAQANRMYLVSGHYDSRNTDVLDTHGFAPGANDDASGVAVSLECARVLSKHKFSATIVFAAVAGEEQGLLGSRHLAQLAKQEHWQMEGVLNNDIVGGNTTPGDTLQDKSAVRVFSQGVPRTATPAQLKEIEAIGAENDSPSRELARGIADSARTYLERRTEGFRPVLEFRPDRYHRGGDHSSFNLEGFAAVRITEWREDYNHQHQNVRTEGGTEYGDVLKFVDFTYVANVARMNAAALATFASAPGEPTDVQIENKVLENTSTLEWKAPQGAPADTAYQIVWRETTAPDWQFAADAATFGEKSSAGEHRVTLPISKDNVIFGVRSVDRAGHRSMVATPGISGRPQPQGS